ncbi:hypothetical protein EDD16DRAFT_1533010 [Pisolithus croceorrhizus]|nr:hypothetical protein EV401DRAFT_1917086 [Pisolithus croceorrhizus]KAI6132570.1 hypothetical protein EDD16DRAFT_1533010 [Pisolithus croceorrhizus]KAI6139864.1 hypothetical protein EDD17DRAFT_1500010 [Pisolithus thermaeus]
MHPCLLVTEILLHIIGFLETSAEYQSTCHKGDVARLARTCRAFIEPALDVLWRTQCALGPLVKCLPGRLWTRDACGDINLIGKPTSNDWLSLRRYSFRIRVFEPSWPSHVRLPGVGDNTLSAIFSPGVFHALFPSLHTLNLEFLANKIAPSLLHHVLSPRLLQLRFRLPRHLEPDDLHELLESITDRAPSLRVLKIDAYAHVLSFFLHLELGFGRIPHLRTLCFPSTLCVSPSSLLQPRQMQYLRVLSLTLTTDPVPALRHSSQAVFPALQYMKITAHTLYQCSELLRITTSSQLEEVSMFYSSQASEAVVHTFLQEVEKAHGRSGGLHTLVLQHLFTTSGPTLKPFVYSPSTLKPLLACHCFRVLDIRDIGDLAIDDAFIANAALAWPRLEELRLRGLPWIDSHHTTVASLRELIRGCSRLARLSMAIDARALPEKNSAWRSSPLEELNISDSQMEDPEAVERYLRAALPDLKRLIALDNLQCWRAVLRMEGVVWDE